MVIIMANNENQSCKMTSIGGQALIEGIMMRGPEVSAMAVRDPQGEIVLEKWKTTVSDRPKFTKLPFIRGMFNFIESMKTGYRCLMRSAEISMPEEDDPNKPKTENEKKKESAAIGVAAAIGGVLGVALAVVLFMWLPSQLFSWLSGAVPSLNTNFLRSLFEGVMRILLFVGYVSVMCFVKDIRRTFEYHGAEHKTIFCYEAGLPLTVENIRKQRRFHPRCGTSFMILMLLVGIIIGMFITVTNPLLRTVIKLALLPLTMGIGYELIRLCGRHDNIFTRMIAAPGVWLQRITVKEPDDAMIECAIAAMNAVIPENHPTADADEETK